MSSTRQLAAIMFTDIVGYTALMGRDEQKAFETIHKNRQIHKSIIERHKGKFLKEIGDGILASFPTVSDAVYSAVEIRKKVEKEGYRLRIGIHLGEVVFEKHDVFGDGVNIASRIQAAADEGEILVSESVYRNIANKKGLQVEYLREQQLKNVDTPIKISRVTTTNEYEKEYKLESYSNEKNSKGKNRTTIALVSVIILLAAGYFLYPVLSQRQSIVNSTITEKKSIAVLPFTDNSPQKDQEYLGDGIAEEILNVLNTQIKDLTVTGRTSSFSFKGKEVDLKTIGKILNVTSILEGSVQKLGNNIRVAIRLINASDGRIVWTEPFERELKDISGVQNEIAARVSEKLKLTLFSENINNEKRKIDPEAYEMVLKGNYCFNKGSTQGYTEAVEYHKRSIAIDPTYAYPYIRLGWALYRLTLSGQYPAKPGFDSVRKEIEKGLSLDVSASEKQSSHIVLAYINLWQYNWKDAKAEYGKAFAISPKPDGFDAFYQSFALGKTNDGITIMKKIVDENPVDLSNIRDLAILQFSGRQFENGKKTCDKIIALDSTFSEAYRIRGSIYFSEKQIDSAVNDFNKAIALNNPWAPLLMIRTLGYIGKKNEAEKLYGQVDQVTRGNIPAMARALIYHCLGNSDKTFEWLNRSYDEKDFWLASIKVDPIWDPLRSDPRFETLIRKMSFLN